MAKALQIDQVVAQIQAHLWLLAVLLLVAVMLFLLWYRARLDVKCEQDVLAMRKNLPDPLAGLKKNDRLVLRLAVEATIADGLYSIYDDRVLERGQTLGITISDYQEALDVLDRAGYIKALRPPTYGISSFSITIKGFKGYAQTYLTDYEMTLRAVARYILDNWPENTNPSPQHPTSYSIAHALHQNHRMIHYILDILQEDQCLNLMKPSGYDNWFILCINPMLNRIAREP